MKRIAQSIWHNFNYAVIGLVDSFLIYLIFLTYIILFDFRLHPASFFQYYIIIGWFGVGLSICWVLFAVFLTFVGIVICEWRTPKKIPVIFIFNLIALVGLFILFVIGLFIFALLCLIIFSIFIPIEVENLMNGI